MNSVPAITVGLVVMNGERYIRRCLDALIAQTYDHQNIAVQILLNPSSDSTGKIIENHLPALASFYSVQFTQSTQNLGMWRGHEQLWNTSKSEYILVLSADVIMSSDFIQNAIRILDADRRIGALQGKIYQFRIDEVEKGKPLLPDLIDTCGFKIFRSRRIINSGQGETDDGQYDTPLEIFGVEGAVPVFRRAALESIKIMDEIADPDLFWYAEDLDVAWRIRLMGWKEVYEPTAIAWHDRLTSKSVKKHWRDYFLRVPLRQAIPIRKRRLLWRNVHWTIVKNDYIINILKDLPWFLAREIAVLGYMLLFEPGVFPAVLEFFKLLPKMLKKRHGILRKAKVSPAVIHRFFN